MPTFQSFLKRLFRACSFQVGLGVLSLVVLCRDHVVFGGWLLPAWLPHPLAAIEKLKMSCSLFGEGHWVVPFCQGSLREDQTHLADTVFWYSIYLLFFSFSFHRLPISSQHFIWEGFFDSINYIKETVCSGLLIMATAYHKLGSYCYPEEFKLK